MGTFQIVNNHKLNVQDNNRCLIKKLRLCIQQQSKEFICHALRHVPNVSKKQTGQNKSNSHYHHITQQKSILHLKESSNVITFSDLKELKKKIGQFSSLNMCIDNFQKLIIKFHQIELNKLIDFTHFDCLKINS